MMNSQAYVHRAPTASTVFGADDNSVRNSGKQKKHSFGESFERFVVLTHRWIAICVCVLFIVWFVSGFVMGFSRFPLLTSDAKLNILPPIAWQQVSTGPAGAIQALGLTEFPKKLRLQMAGRKPVYMVTDWHAETAELDGRNYAVSADTGRGLPPVSPNEALAIVKQELHAPNAVLDRANFQHDQWTVSADFAQGSPYDLVSLNDRAGTNYYVSTATGDLVQRTTASQRLVNWFGTIPHWLYFSFLRYKTGTWTWVVDILASFGIFVVLSGIWIGVKRIRIRKKYSNAKHLPFSGWKRWHAILGLTGGLSIAFWMITGLGAMYPGGILAGRSLSKDDIIHFRGTRAPSFPAVNMHDLSEVARNAKEVDFGYMAGVATVSLRYSDSPPRLLNAVTLKPITLQSSLFRRAVSSLDPTAKLVSLDYLAKGDDYWYSDFDGSQTLPISRAIFNNGLWFYMKSGVGSVVGVYDEANRVDRWTNTGWHSLDWHWGEQHKPWWVALLFLTLLPGLAISVTGLVIGVRRLKLETVPAVPLLPVPMGPEGLVAGERSPEVAKKCGVNRVCIVYASQTGTAEELARQMHIALVGAGIDAERYDLAEISPSKLAGGQLVLFIVATTGEGDPPDRVIPFARKYMRKSAQLCGVTYAVLALGDSNYGKYAQFGRQMDAWLSQSGANRLFRTVAVDSADKSTVDTWVRNLECSLDTSIALDQTEAFAEWRLVSRRLVNKGSVGAPVFRVELVPANGSADWLPGQVVRVKAGVEWVAHLRGEGDAIREYSIASLPSDGNISLLVRVAYRDDGAPGIGSGWLTGAPIGTSMALRVRSNPGFVPAPYDRPAIFIGNGTGYAGLRAHLLLRVQQGQQRNWLIFGERNRSSDYYCREDVDNFTKAGCLEACNLVFSRDQRERVYVQESIRQCPGQIRSWVQSGACVFVCGSQHGMAPGVDKALRDVLGDSVLTQMAESGRYRRDVYYQ